MPLTRHDDVDFVNVNFGESWPKSDDDATDYCHHCLDVVVSEWITDEIEISPEVTTRVFDPSSLLIEFRIRSLCNVL